MIQANTHKMADHKHIRVIKPADEDHKTKNIGRQAVIDSDLLHIFITLKKEHGRDISPAILQDSFKKNPFDFQRFLANQLNGDFNTDGIDGIIGPKTAKDVSRINYIDDISNLEPDLKGIVTSTSTITRDTDKNTILGTSKNAPPIDLGEKEKRGRASRYKKKSPIRKFKT